MPAFSDSRQPERGPGWFGSTLALRLWQAEQRDIVAQLTGHVGVRGLYLRPSEQQPTQLSGNMLQSVISLYRQGTGFAGDLRCLDEDLPIGADSLSLVYALHVLETSPAPQTLLGEIERCLMPEGLAFIVALSPLSPWRLHWRGCARHSWSLSRLRTELQGAGLTLEQVRAVGPAWPDRNGRGEAQARDGAARLLDRLRSGMLLVARKRRPGMTALANRKSALRLAAQARPG